MGALAAAGCAWSARGDPRYGGKWAWLARRGHCMASSWGQRAVRVDRFVDKYTTVQATIAKRDCGLYNTNLYSVQLGCMRIGGAA